MTLYELITQNLEEIEDYLQKRYFGVELDFKIGNMNTLMDQNWPCWTELKNTKPVEGEPEMLICLNKKKRLCVLILAN